MRNREGEKANIKIIGITVLGNRDLILPELPEKGINTPQNFLPEGQELSHLPMNCYLPLSEGCSIVPGCAARPLDIKEYPRAEYKTRDAWESRDIAYQKDN